jgi:hypothetical protein
MFVYGRAHTHTHTHTHYYYYYTHTHTHTQSGILKLRLRHSLPQVRIRVPFIDTHIYSKFVIHVSMYGYVYLAAAKSTFLPQDPSSYFRCIYLYIVGDTYTYVHGNF